MDSLKNLANLKRIPTKKDPKLHSANHVLADELSQKFNDRKHFGLYLKLAVTIPHPVLRKIAGEILENPKVETPGKLFSYLVKKYNQSLKQ
jgi:hypothetical protein